MLRAQALAPVLRKYLCPDAEYSYRGWQILSDKQSRGVWEAYSPFILSRLTYTRQLLVRQWQ
jgi:hypothetical protein